MAFKVGDTSIRYIDKILTLDFYKFAKNSPKPLDIIKGLWHNTNAAEKDG
jgi:hypothetical protein